MKKQLVIVGITLLLLAVAFSGCMDYTNEEDNVDSSSQVENQSPTASCSAHPLSGTEPLTVYFTGLGSDTDGYIVSYYWNFGDSETSSYQSPSHTYGSSGTYTAILTVSDDDDATDSDSITITVEEKVTPPDFETIGISNNGVTQTINYLEKPVKLMISGSNCDITVTKETNLIDVRISGIGTIVRVSKSHSFTSGISGPDSEIVYYD